METLELTNLMPNALATIYGAHARTESRARMRMRITPSGMMPTGASIRWPGWMAPRCGLTIALSTPRR